MELSLFSDTDFRLWGAITRVRDTVVKAREKELAGLGITSIETYALFLLYDAKKSIMPIQLSREMHRNHNTVSALLLRMENKGLIVRNKDKYNNNIWQIKLSDKGADLCRRAMKIDSIHYVMAGLSSQAKEELESRLTDIENRALKLVREDPSAS